ncbi:MAG: hypothetical protein L6Q97_02300 [Thermoanaerobaculia bacterium]|nr:hypothetical protein [Thermoanaerobaculia bacterium]
MSSRIVSLALLLTFALSAFAQTTEKTFTKAFNTEGKTRIKLDLPGTIDLKVWNNPTIRMEIIVSLPSGNVSMLDQLANVGRYNLSAQTTDESLIITAPNLAKVVRVKGEEIKENVSYIIFVPKDLQVEMHSPTAMAEMKK